MHVGAWFDGVLNEDIYVLKKKKKKQERVDRVIYSIVMDTSN